MSRADSAATDRRLTFLAATLVALLGVAACGGGSSTAPTGGPGASPTSGETEGPDESEGTGESQAPGDASEAFTAATTALDALDSYSYSVEIEAVDTASGTSHTRLSGTVDNAQDGRLLNQQTLDADGNVTDESAILIIGTGAWLRQGGDDAEWTAVPAAQADVFVQSLAAYRPEQMFGLYFAGFGGNFAEVGSETKNGVETTHYQGDEALGAMLGAIAGVQGKWSSDAWIATDGGYLVHSEASAAGESGGTGGSFKIVVDITDINSAEALQPPS
jgi:hypothetical protein